MSRSRSRQSWWTEQMGGMPYWAIIASAVFVVGILVWVLITMPARVAAQPDVNRTPGPVPTFYSGPELQVVSVIGDSYTAGSGENTAGRTWPTLLPADLNIVIDSHAVGGVGYTDGTDAAIPAQAGLIREDADLVIMFGSRNDVGDDADLTYSEAVRTLGIIRERAPDATIVMVGFPWVDDAPGDAVLATRDALARAATDNGVVWVDALSEGWLLGESLIGTDGVHPNDAGHDALALRMTDVIRGALPAAD